MKFNITRNGVREVLEISSNTSLDDFASIFRQRGINKITLDMSEIGNDNVLLLRRKFGLEWPISGAKFRELYKSNCAFKTEALQIEFIRAVLGILKTDSAIMDYLKQDDGIPITDFDIINPTDHKRNKVATVASFLKAKRRLFDNDISDLIIPETYKIDSEKASELVSEAMSLDPELKCEFNRIGREETNILQSKNCATKNSCCNSCNRSPELETMVMKMKEEVDPQKKDRWFNAIKFVYDRICVGKEYINYLIENTGKKSWNL